MDYFESRAQDYLEKSHRGLWKFFREREFSSVTRALRPSPGLSALDLGCGAGYYALRLRDEFGMEVLGVDSASAMLQVLQTHDIPNWLGRAEALPNWNPFDRVLAAGLLEFVAEPEMIFRNAARLLEREGVLTLVVPRAGIAGAAYKAAHEWKNCPVFIRADSDYIKMAEGQGFKLCALEVCTPISMTLGFELRANAKVS